MKRTRTILALLVATNVIMGIGGASYAQPNIPQEKIPFYLPSDVRLEIETLYSSDPLERGRAAHDLGEMGSKADLAIPFLIGILGDSSALGRTPQNYNFGLIETTPGIPTSPGEEAAKALVKIQGAAALERLKVGLKDTDSRVRYSAVCGLGKIGEPAVEPLILALRDSDRRIREGAAWVLGEIRDVRAVEPLIALLKDEAKEVKKHAAWALGKIKEARAVGPLIAALKDSDQRVRWSAQWALGRIGEPAVEPLISVLEDSDRRVREGAAWALGEIKDGGAVEPLIGALNDENKEVRKHTVWALGKIGDERSIEPLIALLKDSDDRVQQEAAWALGKIGEPAVEPLILALRDSDRRIREGAAWVLGEIRDEQAVEPLIRMMKDDDLEVRKNAAWALRQIIWALSDDSLARFKTSRIVESLVVAIGEGNEEIQKYVADILGSITGKNFGQDAPKWQEWWQENKRDFLKAKV